MTVLLRGFSNIHVGGSTGSTTSRLLYLSKKTHSCQYSTTSTGRLVKRTSSAHLASSVATNRRIALFSTLTTSKRNTTCVVSHNGHEITLSNIPHHEQSNKNHKRSSTTVESFFSAVTPQQSELSSPQSQALLKEIRARAEKETDFLILFQD